MREISLRGSGGVRLHANAWSPLNPTGAPMLLVHGLASNARLFDGVATTLAEHGHPVVAIDQRGHGLSDKPDDGYDFTTIIEDLLGVIDQLDWTAPIVVGQSWGGNVAVELGARAPARLGAVAAIDGGVITLSAGFPRWSQCAHALQPPTLTGLSASRLRASMRAAHPDWPPAGIDGAMRCFEVRTDGTVAPWLTRERHMLILRELWSHRPLDRLAEVQLPTVLIMARNADRGWSNNKQQAVDEAIASNGYVSAHWIEGDHDLHAQHPGVVAKLLHELSAA